MQIVAKSKRREQNEVRQSVSRAMPGTKLDTKHWWRHPNLRRLNLLMIIPLLSIFTLGSVFHLRDSESKADIPRFDGSMMNGLQSVEPWRAYFGEPKGSTLGLFNAAYPIGGLCAVAFVGYGE